VHALRILVASLSVENGRERPDITRHIDVVGPQGSRPDREAMPRERFGDVVAPARVLEAGHVVIEASERRVAGPNMT